MWSCYYWEVERVIGDCEWERVNTIKCWRRNERWLEFDWGFAKRDWDEGVSDERYAETVITQERTRNSNY